MSTFKKMSQVAYTFLLLNWAVISGLYCFAQGHRGFWDLAQAPKVRAQAPKLRLP